MIILFVLLILLALPARAIAQIEAWCTSNPTFCTCSRTFQTTGPWVNDLVVAGEAKLWAFYQPNETATASTFCGTPVGGKLAVEMISGGATPTQVSSGVAGALATQFSWTMVTKPQSIASLPGRRVGVRYYIRTSSNYVSTNLAGVEGATVTAEPCSNDKYTQLGDYLTGYASYYTTSNGGAGFNGWSPINRRSRWVMIEHYIQVYSFAATTHEYHMTDLATGDHYNFNAAGRLSTIQLTDVTDVIHRYRAGSASGTCAGTYQVMYAVMASWPAGGTQRIPAASEITGGASPPTAPSGLAVTTP